MTGTRESIFAEIEARLIVALSGEGPVEVEPTGDPDAVPCYGITDEGHRPIEFEAGTTRYELNVTVDGYVEGNGGADALARLNAHYERAKAALITEPPLGGIVESIDEGAFRRSRARIAAARRLGFELEFTIVFSTDRGSDA